MKKPTLHTKDLSLSYPSSTEKVIESANLEVNSGEIVLLLGENGSGKSTLLRGLSGLIEIDAGDVFLKEKTLSNWSKSELAREMALVLTNKQYQALLQVEEFVAFGRYPFTNWLGKLGKEDKEAVEESLVSCGLASLRHNALSDLSDGERQKVFLARALAQQAKLLILDEPTTHLDVKNTTAQLRLIKRLVEEESKTVVFSSHQFDLALQIADKVWLIEGNKVHQIKTERFYEDCIYQEILLGDSYRYDKQSKRFRITL
ncbi:MAG: ABC transporter ATP-binding protein [Vicingaceae bacterium]